MDITKDIYVETLIVRDKMVNVFMNDYGQCYWFQWLENGELKDMSCGTYNTDYKEFIEDYFKPLTERMANIISDLKLEVRDLRRKVDELENNS